MHNIKNIYEKYAEDLYREHPTYYHRHKTWFKQFFNPPRMGV